MMKVLGICGSHREHSATMFFLKRALREIEKAHIDTEAVTLYDKDLRPCVACNKCGASYDCTLKDDAADICGKMASAAGVIIASPSYFSMVSGKVKTLFDRSLPLRRNGMKLSGKAIGAIAVGASRNGGQEHVCAEILRWGGLHEMVAVTDEGTAHFGGIGWVPRGSEPKDDRIGIETCENMGRKMAATLKRMRR